MKIIKGKREQILSGTAILTIVSTLSANALNRPPALVIANKGNSQIITNNGSDLLVYWLNNKGNEKIVIGGELQTTNNRM